MTDPLDAFLESAKPPEPPEDLAARIVAATADLQRHDQLYWSDVEAVARKAMLASAAALLLSVGLAGYLVGPAIEPPAPVVASQRSNDVEEDLDLGQALERQVAGGFMLLGGER
jgi:hypothetical protein